MVSVRLVVSKGRRSVVEKHGLHTLRLVRWVNSLVLLEHLSYYHVTVVVEVVVGTDETGFVGTEGLRRGGENATQTEGV